MLKRKRVMFEEEEIASPREAFLASARWQQRLDSLLNSEKCPLEVEFKAWAKRDRKRVGG